MRNPNIYKNKFADDIAEKGARVLKDEYKA